MESVTGECGGERKDFWYEIRKNKLGLIVGGNGGVSDEEANVVGTPIP